MELAKNVFFWEGLEVRSSVSEDELEVPAKFVVQFKVSELLAFTLKISNFYDFFQDVVRAVSMTAFYEEVTSKKWVNDYYPFKPHNICAQVAKMFKKSLINQTVNILECTSFLKNLLKPS